MALLAIVPTGPVAAKDIHPSSDVPSAGSNPYGGGKGGGQNLASPPLTDRLAELPDGTDEVLVEDGWSESAEVPVEVRATDAVTTLPDESGGSAETETVPEGLAPSEGQDETPVEVTVEPSGENYAPGLFVTLDPTDPAEPSEDDGSPGVPSETPTPGGDEPPPAGRVTAEDDQAEADPEDGDPATDDAAVRAVEVRLSYADFRHAFGGDWGSRLQVISYPSCFRTTPEAPGCSEGVLIPSVNDPATETITFTTTDLNHPAEALISGLGGSAGMPAATAPRLPMEGGDPGSTVLVTGAAAGETGDYGSTAIQPSASWQVGESSGAFTYSYPIAAPAPAVAGPSPSLSLTYSSGSVDGMTKAVNGQASMMGIGWDFDPGHIVRQYANCFDDGWSTKGDKCWKTTGGVLVQQLSIVLNGRASTLIQVPGTSRYRLQDDPGWQVNLISNPTGSGFDPNGPSNTDNNNEAFKVRTPDGTTYWFGYGHGSGATLRVPVFGNNSGEPCYSSTASAAWCHQAWRWNLDKVVDRNGNEINYTYGQETNRYKRYNTTSTEYDRNGWLSSVHYGGSSSSTDESRVVLSTAPRCIPALADAGANCSGSNGPRAKPQIWPDVPGDQICDENDSCSNLSPTFFSTKRYDKITTKRYTARISGGLTQNVDTYQLHFDMPKPGPDDQKADGIQDLWLASISRTGGEGSESTDAKLGAKTLPDVLFHGKFLHNRVATPNGAYSFNKLRIDQIRTETGARSYVTYGHAAGKACTSGSGGTPGANRWASTKECFPQKINGSWEWWHKYVVTRLELGDNALQIYPGEATGQKQGRLQVFDYEYLGDAGWRYRNNPVVPSASETWDDWRGYEKVKVHQRNVGPDQLIDPGDVVMRQIVTYRGLHNTRANEAGSTLRTVSVETNRSAPTPDHIWLSGRMAEELVYDKGIVDTANLLSRHNYEYAGFTTADSPYAYSFNAVYSYPRYEFVKARGGLPDRTVTTTVNDGGDSAPAIAEHTDQMLGAILSVYDDHGTPGTSAAALADDTVECTTWRTNNGTALRVPILGRTKGSDGTPTTAELDCANDTGQFARTAHYYDGSTTYGTNPVDGNETMTGRFVSGGTAVRTNYEYDGYGRIRKTSLPYYNAADTGLDYETIYNGASGLPTGTTSSDMVMSVTTTSPATAASAGVDAVPAMTTTIRNETRRGLPGSTTDPNGKTTTITRDGLGRAVYVDLPGLPAGVGHSIAYEYDVNTGVPSDIKTTMLRDVVGGNAVTDTSYDFYDGWGRQIEHVEPNAQGDGAVLTATTYNEQGLPELAAAALAVPIDRDFATNPNFSAAYHYTDTVYDGAGRPTAIYEKLKVATRSRTLTSYGTTGSGTSARPVDTVEVLTPLGSPDPTPLKAKTVTNLDLDMRPTRVTQEDVNQTTPDNGVADYSYYPSGLLKDITSDAALLVETGNEAVNSYKYDWLGRRTESDDADAGKTGYTYDAAGNTTVVTDPVLQTVTTGYDVLGRPIKRMVSGQSSPVATWTYDTATNGLGRLTSTTTPTGLDGVLAGNVTSSVLAYDVRGNPLTTAITYPGTLTGEATSSKTSTYTYNQLGAVKTMGSPGVTEAGLPAATVTMSYGPGGSYRSTAVGGRVIGAAEYDNVNRPEGLDSTGAGAEFGLERIYDWNDEGTLKELTAKSRDEALPGNQTDASFLYSYDLLGNPTNVRGSQQLTPGGATSKATWCYTYDGISRLVSAKAGEKSEDCADDPLDDGSGVRLLAGAKYDLAYEFEDARIKSVSSPTPGGTRTVGYTYADAGHDHAVTTLGATGGTLAPGLPATGNLSYDPSGRVQTWKASGVPDLVYTYDVQGNLVRTDGGEVGVTTRYAYDADGIRLVRTDSASTTLYLGALEITNEAGTTSARRTYTAPGGTPLALETRKEGESGAPVLTWLLGDPQHSIRLSKNVTTGADTLYTYFPYGDPANPSQTVPGEKGFLDKTHDPNTGEVRLDHRNYDPSVNTLTSPDPLLDLSDPQNLNAYAYARNNPIAFSDPTGLDICAPPLAHTLLGIPCPNTSGGGTGGGPNGGDGGNEGEGGDSGTGDASPGASTTEKAFDLAGEISGIKPVYDDCIDGIEIAGCAVSGALVVPWGRILKGTKVAGLAGLGFLGKLLGLERRLDKTSGALRVLPGGDLAAHELAGGHTLLWHVGKTDDELAARFLDAPSWVRRSSSFADENAASQFIGDAIDVDFSNIVKWLESSDRASHIIRTWGSAVSTGRSVARGSTTGVDVYGVRVVLRKDVSMSTGYRIHTAFPE